MMKFYSGIVFVLLLVFGLVSSASAQVVEWNETTLQRYDGQSAAVLEDSNENLLIVSGNSKAPSDVIDICRLTPNGELDLTFGNN